MRFQVFVSTLCIIISLKCDEFPSIFEPSFDHCQSESTHTKEDFNGLTLSNDAVKKNLDCYPFDSYQFAVSQNSVNSHRHACSNHCLQESIDNIDINILHLTTYYIIFDFDHENVSYWDPFKSYGPSFVFYAQALTYHLLLAFSLFPADFKTLLGKRMIHPGNSKKTVLLYICMLYVLHAGDTESNPGPEFPCNICNQECDWSRYAVQCDSCDLWYHADCMSMSSEVYATLEDNNVTWICCSCGLPNFASSLFSSRSTILSNSFNYPVIY